MSHHRVPAAVAASLLGCAILAAPAIAFACCPSGGNTDPKASQGLGESFPPAADLAADPAWQVYTFERDGIQYLQINDSAGVVRAAVGSIGGTRWVLPVGKDADRVGLPGDAPTAAGTGVVIYRGPDVEIRRHQGTNGDSWSIVPGASE
jgi:hypothetical protein